MDLRSENGGFGNVMRTSHGRFMYPSFDGDFKKMGWHKWQVSFAHFSIMNVRGPLALGTNGEPLKWSKKLILGHWNQQRGGFYREKIMKDMGQKNTQKAKKRWD